MNSYYIVFGVILALAIMNYFCLFWILKLQKRLHHAKNVVAKPSLAAAPATPQLTAEQTVELSGKLNNNAEAAIEAATAQFKLQLKKTFDHIDQNVGELSDKVVQDELIKYQNALDEVRQESIDTLSEVQQAVDKRRAELEGDLAAEIAAEKERILERFERQIGEVVSGYLVETLGTNVDLGAQSKYVLATLEEHKEELKKALTNGP